MRRKTLDAIDALHAKISDLVEAEKRHYDKTHPNENNLWRSVAHTRIEMARYCPAHRANMVEAIAAFPRSAQVGDTDGVGSGLNSGDLIAAMFRDGAGS